MKICTAATSLALHTRHRPESGQRMGMQVARKLFLFQIDLLFVCGHFVSAAVVEQQEGKSRTIIFPLVVVVEGFSSFSCADK